MALAKEILEFDPRAFSISRRFDDRVREYISKRENIPKEDKFNLLDILDNYSDLLNILNGFENPPIEIIEQLTEDGKVALYQYYETMKKKLIEKYCEKIILNFDSIHEGYSLIRSIRRYESKINDIIILFKDLSEFIDLNNEILDSKIKTRETLIQNPKFHLLKKLIYSKNMKNI